MLVNRKEQARRIAHLGGYKIEDVENVLKLQEFVIAQALKNGESVKQGDMYKILLEFLPEKQAYDGINKKYFTREAKYVPKIKPLALLKNISISADPEEK
jgi:hypothetical protein